MEAGFGFGNYWVVGGLLGAVSPFDGYFFISIFFFYGDGGFDLIVSTNFCMFISSTTSTCRVAG